MNIGIAIEETWDFFNEIYADLSDRHKTRLFNRREIRAPFFYERINRAVFHHDMQVLLKSSDVVFFEWSSNLLVAASNFPKVCGIVTRLHRYEMYQWVNQVNWEMVDKIILVSRAKQQEFIYRFPDHASKTVVIPVGVSLHKYQPHQKLFEGDIGILCHLTPRKRVYEIILVFYELTRKGFVGRLHIGGGPDPAFYDYYQALNELVIKLNIQDKVIFYGNITETWLWYSNIDIFISNSYSEGLQVAPMEAMASGVYCLSHHWTGADELVPESQLYITDTELINKVLSYCGESESGKLVLRESMREHARQNFDIENIKIRIRSVVEDVGTVRKKL